MKSTLTFAAAIAATAVLSACSSTSSQQYPASGTNSTYNGGYNGGYNQPAASTGYGVIESIQVTRGTAGTSGSGAVVGGLVGALAGNQVGSGNGRTAATVAGALGGAVVGNSVEANRNQNAQEMYQINVRLDNGEYRTLVQDSVYDLRVGNRVRVVDGRAYRY